MKISVRQMQRGKALQKSDSEDGRWGREVSESGCFDGFAPGPATFERQLVAEFSVW